MIRNRLKRMARRLLGDKPQPARPAQAVPKRPSAPARQFDLDTDEGPEDEKIDVEVDSALVADWISEGRPMVFVDIREVPEVMSGHVVGALLMPMGDVPDRRGELPLDRELVLYCAAGNRTYQVAHYLREQGFDKAWSMLGGIGSWLAQGGEQVIPPQGAAFRLVDSVEVDGRVGTIQEIRQTGGGVVYSVEFVDESGARERVDGLDGDRLSKVQGAKR